MRTTVPALLGCATLTAVAAVLPALPAQAAPAHAVRTACTTKIKTARMTPKVIPVHSVGISKGFFEMTVHDSCGDLDIDVDASFDDGIRDTPIDVEGFNGYPYYGPDDDYYAYGNAYFDPTDLTDDEATTWSGVLTADGSASDFTEWGSFRLVRAATVTANAGPEPVRKGHTVTVTGKLTRADWEAGHDVAYGKKKVALQFRTKTGAYVTVKTVTGSAKGAYKTTTTAKKDGFYRFVYAGNVSTGATRSAGDYVDVH